MNKSRVSWFLLGHSIVSDICIFSVWTSSSGLNCCRHYAARQNCRYTLSSHTTAMLQSHTNVRHVTSALLTRHICRNIYAFTSDWNHTFARCVCNKHFRRFLLQLGLDRYHVSIQYLMILLATAISIKIPEVTFVRYCGQGSSLLWTPALRPLCRSNAPAQGEEGNW